MKRRGAFLSVGDTSMSMMVTPFRPTRDASFRFFFSLYTPDDPALLCDSMGAKIILYVVVALLIGSSVFLAVHSLRDDR